MLFHVVREGVAHYCCMVLYLGAPVTTGESAIEPGLGMVIGR